MRDNPGDGAVDRRLNALFREGSREQIVALAHEAARRSRTTPLPETLPAYLGAALQTAGMHGLYGHQRAAYDLLDAGQNVVVSTGTASGKSLCYQLPVLERQARDPQSRCLCLFPTKALAQDQLRKLVALDVPGALPAIYDGDTPPEARALVRRTATILLSNPDMLHVGILPNHERWAEYLHHLNTIVVDEAHVYRGVFGSHVAQVIRRLRRLCAHYGSSPQLILTSATMARPEDFALRLTGVPCTSVEEDQAPRPERTIVFWDPPLIDATSGERVSALAEAAALTAECILAGARVITFAPGRKAAELILGQVRRRLNDRDPGGAEDRVQPYRAGYTPRQRRDIERRLFERELDGVIATQALELGIDVGALDVAIVTGFPGTVTSLRQRWGRAGRRGHGWAVLVAGQDALDQYFMQEPDRLLDRGFEEAIIDLHNPHIAAAHLAAAAYERPLTPHDTQYFGEQGLLTAERLAESGILRRRAEGYSWAEPFAPASLTSLRSASAEHLVIVESRNGEIIGHMERERVFRHAHPGAVYLHLGVSYLVRELDLVNRTVLVDEFDGAYYTQARIDKNVLQKGQAAVRELAGGALVSGEIEVTERVSAYLRRDIGDQHVIDTVGLDLPEQAFTTQAFWVIMSQPSLAAALAELAEDDDLAAPGSLHAAEHALIALLPLHAMCDRWDVGGLSTPWHWQNDAATIFVYDGYPGGIGLSRRGYDAFEHLAADALSLVSRCPCRCGCPSCVQSPKCGNLNEPLNKEGAMRLLRALLGAADASPATHSP